MNRVKVSGWLLLIAGLAQMVLAGQMNVTMPAEPGIANTDLMLQRELFFNGGGFAFLAGVITLAADRICAALAAKP